MTDKPNVLLLTIDTLRADVLSSYGYKSSPRPNLDRLADTSIRFEQAITGGSWTQAAFPVMLTSTYASMYGGCLGRLAFERPSLVGALAAHGYTTAGFSTNPHLSRATGYDRGFHHFYDLVPHETDPALRRMKGGQRLLQNTLFQSVAKAAGRRMRPARLYCSAAEVTDQVTQWLEQAETPFFAWVHFMDMHWPYHLEHTLTRPSGVAQAWRDLAIMYGRSNTNGDGAITTAQRDRFVGLYEQALHYLDAQIGRLLESLARLGYDEDTIVVAVADHGEEFLEHGRWGHWESNLFDEILKVPLIMRLPHVSQGRTIQRQVPLLDLMPTLLDLCGCPSPAGVAGTSFAPLLTGCEANYEGETVISEMQREPWHRIAVRTESFKYIWDNKHPDRPELYDLAADPGEKQNKSAEYPEMVGQFQAMVDAHLQRKFETVPAAGVSSPEFDGAVMQRLRDLGYLE
jgi:arylsulfatase A-like enzyme